MFKGLLCLAFLFATTALAEDCVVCKKPEPPKKVIYKTVTVKEPCCQKEASKTESKSDASVDSSTGNQTITINFPPPAPVVTPVKVKVIKRTLIKTRVKKVAVYHYDPNRLLLLVGQTKTKMEVEGDCCYLTANRKYEPDFGLQYVRDFGHVSGTVIGTLNKSLYLGLGFNW